ncbi:MAG TPA: hypothetical protein VMR73_01030 [Candidatus Paceibacterota bacterium]|nr:hypothetical protein [Candidatus Paceibacterota bacterium]
MPPTITVHGSDGEVMAPMGRPDEFLRGKHTRIKVTVSGSDGETPKIIRDALVGLEVETIFSREQLAEQGCDDLVAVLPEGSHLAYGGKVIEALQKAEKTDAAKALQEMMPNELDMYVFEGGIFVLV